MSCNPKELKQNVYVFLAKLQQKSKTIHFWHSLLNHHIVFMYTFLRRGYLTTQLQKVLFFADEFIFSIFSLTRWLCKLLKYGEQIVWTIFVILIYSAYVVFRNFQIFIFSEIYFFLRTKRWSLFHCWFSFGEGQV